MSLYIKDENNQSGLLLFGNKTEEFPQKFRVLNVGDVVTLKSVALGLPEGFQELVAVKVVSIHGLGTKGSIGCPGGKLRIEHNGAWLGFSGSAILELSLTA